MSHLSAELEWAQFLVIMVVGFMLLYDCVLNRKSARKLEGLLAHGQDAIVEGMNLQSENDRTDTSGAPVRFATVNSQCNLGNCQSAGGILPAEAQAMHGVQGMLGSMEPPVYYPTLSDQRDQQRGFDQKEFDQYMSKYNTTYARAVAGGAEPKDAAATAAAQASTEGFKQISDDDLMATQLNPY